MKLLNKQIVIFSIFCFLFTTIVSGDNPTNSPLKLSVIKIKKDIVPPVKNPYNFSDIEIDISIENISKSHVQFDQIKAVFFHNNKPISASTYILEKTKFDEGIALGGYHADGRRIAPPEVASGLLITIKKGQIATFQFQTANSRYGSLNPVFKRELILNFYKNNKLVYGPYKIAIKL